jgi:hypothetical protein
MDPTKVPGGTVTVWLSFLRCVDASTRYENGKRESALAGRAAAAIIVNGMSNIRNAATLRFMECTVLSVILLLQSLIGPRQQAIVTSNVVAVRRPVKRSKVMLIDVDVRALTTGIAVWTSETALAAH